MKQLLTILTLAFAIGLQAQTTFKVDINEYSRTNMEEVLEPDFTPWRFEKDTYQSTLIVGDVTFTIRSEHNMRGGWNKAFVQKKEYNCRLTGDGVNLDPNECGSFDLVIKGLAPGAHTIQTYHSGWSNPDNTAAWPITVSLNGQVAHQSVPRTEQVSSAQDATVVMTHFTVNSPEEEVVFTFSTYEEEAPTDTDTKKNKDRTPLLNGFMIDVSDTKLQAKLPVPGDKDWHVNADDGTFALQWSPADSNVTKHHFYLGTDSTEVANATIPIYVGTDTTYTAIDLYNLNTYYWRVDEETADGTVTKGAIWSFRPRHLAFPGAEGYGRFATGGRGGVVYHVTNLNHDHNPGSLLYGLVDMKGPRTIVFDVSGIIEMDFKSFFSTPWVTIAPQTAPGKGICLKHCNLGLGGETICRFLRARRGYGDTGNAMGCGNDHTIIDHCTAAWGTDETFSSRGAKNLTFQYNMIAEALGIADHKNYESGKNHGFAATIGGDIGTFSHNLLVDCAGRNWSMGGGLDGNGVAAGALDMFNNVCYNWHSRTTDGGAKWMHFVNNYYKMGPDTENTVLFTAQNELGGHRAQWAYVNGNVRINKNGSKTPDKKGVTYNAQGDYPEETWVDEPFFPSEATIHTAEDAYKIVCSDAGATMPLRDDHHLRMIHETLNQTYTYVGSRSGIRGEIDHEDDQGGWEVFPEETRPADWDTDQDGMPDWWEKITSSDPMTADNNDDPDHDGYTLLEDYLEFMSHPYLMIQPNTSGVIDLKPHFAGFYGQNGKTVTPTYSVDLLPNGVYTASINGSLLTVSTVQPDASGIYDVDVTVNDGETTFTQKFGIAITVDAATAISPIWSEDNIQVKKREFFTLDGKKVTTLRAHETYVMRITDAEGHVQNVKIIKD